MVFRSIHLRNLLARQEGRLPEGAGKGCSRDMKALVLEDDELIAELLQTILVGLYPGAAVYVCDRLAEALEQARQSRFDLFLVDWNLPDGSGLRLVRQVRGSDDQVPVVIISARSDRESVLSAAHYGISGYITKPFDVETVHRRLKDLVAPGVDAAVPDVEDWLSQSLRQGGIQLSSDVDPTDILDLMAREDHLSSVMLAEEWHNKAGLTVRLMEMANSSTFRRTGEPVHSLQGAINLMGIRLALQQALALALDVSGEADNADLKALARQYQDQAKEVAAQARSIAIRLGKPPGLFYRAGLLSRIGELSVLWLLARFLACDGHLGSGDARRLVSEWAPSYGNALKVQWRLPLELREMIGAVHVLPSGSVREDLLIMRAAALAQQAESPDDAEYQRLLRRLRLDSKEE